MTQKKILIIGAGNIGSRHLQGLAMLDTPSTIYVVDPYGPSLETCKSRWEQTNGSHKVSFSTQLPADLKHVDCAIMAATANGRSHETRKLLAQANVENMIFEKVLFQEIGDYQDIRLLLEKHKVRAWVNCPRRVWPDHKEFAQTIKAPAQIHLHVSGSSWGLCCNSIHMIDFAAFLSGQSRYEILYHDLDKNYIPSKREGFVEFTGTFGGKFTDGSSFHIESFATENIPYTLTVKSAHGSAIFHEDNDFYDLCINNIWERKSLSLPFQSMLSGSIVKDILAKGDCDLTPFNDSVELHLPMMKMFTSHWSTITGKEQILCPIT